MRRGYAACTINLLQHQTIYGTVQAALQWYREMYLSLNYLQWNKSNINPCLWYKWMDGYLIVFLLWVDDCFVVGPKQLVLEESMRFREVYDTTDEGEADEYVGCKLTQTKEYLKLTQPVKIRRLIDEFGYSGKKSLQTPVQPKSNLAFEAKDNPQAKETNAKKYASVIEMLLHVARNSRPDCINPMQECSGFMSNVKKACIDHCDYLCNYIIPTKERGYMIKPDKTNWDRMQDYLFIVPRESNADWAKNPSRRSVNSGCTFVNGAMMKIFSQMMKTIALSTTKAELNAAVLTVMDMLLAYYILVSLRLTVKLPICTLITRHAGTFKHTYTKAVPKVVVVVTQWKHGF